MQPLTYDNFEYDKIIAVYSVAQLELLFIVHDLSYICISHKKITQ